MDNVFFNDDDLADLWAELEEAPEGDFVEDDPEVLAAERRYKEIIKKHKQK